MKRIVVVCNKQWEADPVLIALLEKKVNPASGAIVWPSVRLPIDPSHDRTVLSPRAMLRFPSADPAVSPTALIEVWCLEDWMDKTKSSSSSEEKARVLPLIRAWTSPEASQDPDCVLAVGTAGFPSADSYNGSVVIGANVHIHDGHPATEANPASQWRSSFIGAVVPQTFKVDRFFDPAALEPWRFQAEARFVRPPMAAAPEPVILCGASYTAVGIVNVTNYDEYVWADKAALQSFTSSQPRLTAGSVETTHGVIRACFDPVPFLFVSAITDREGSFNMEVGTRSYAQNFACAHNAGVALAWFLPYLAAKL